MNLKSFRSVATLVAVSAVSSMAFAQDITGAGATFPAPLYAKWAEAYNKASGARINYQSVGSGAGLKQIRSKTVDFGASDMPLKDDELAKDGLVQFPTVIGGVVPVVNIKGVQPGQLKNPSDSIKQDLPADGSILPMAWKASELFRAAKSWDRPSLLHGMELLVECDLNNKGGETGSQEVATNLEILVVQLCCF